MLAPSGRSLSELHNSDSGHVGSYLAYWMYSLSCDFDHTGRVLYGMLLDGHTSSGGEGSGKTRDIEAAFREWVRSGKKGRAGVGREQGSRVRLGGVEEESEVVA